MTHDGKAQRLHQLLKYNIIPQGISGVITCPECTPPLIIVVGTCFAVFLSNTFYYNSTIEFFIYLTNFKLSRIYSFEGVQESPGFFRKNVKCQGSDLNSSGHPILDSDDSLKNKGVFMISNIKYEEVKDIISSQFLQELNSKNSLMVVR